MGMERQIKICGAAIGIACGHKIGRLRLDKKKYTQHNQTANP
jgi:hypothetical protein